MEVFCHYTSKVVIIPQVFFTNEFIIIQCCILTSNIPLIYNRQMRIVQNFQGVIPYSHRSSAVKSTSLHKNLKGSPGSSNV